MAINISFGGANIGRPGAYSTVDTSNMVPVSTGALRRLAVIGALGTSGTLVPGKVAYFNDPKEAAKAVGEGDTLEVMRTAWRHGADLIAVSVADVTTPATAPTDTEWQVAIDALQTEFVHGIIPASVEAAVIAKVDTHVTSMSTILNRRRRRGFYGHETGLDSESVSLLATPLSSERALLATPCPLIVGSDGEKEAKPGYFMAAAFAGIWASQPEQEPITYKNVKFDGLETIYTNTEIIELLAAHVAPVEHVDNEGFRIVQGLTTSTDEDLTKSELSVSTLKDTMSVSLENHFERKYVGKGGVVGIEVTIYNDLVTILEQFITNGWISGYVPESVKVTRNGTAFILDWEGKPTLPINNFLITSHFTL